MYGAIDHRIRISGGAAVNAILTNEACKALYVASRGVPREIMKIANAAMLLGAVNGIHPISGDIIKLAVENILKN